jgi:uncharacterized protein
MKRLIDYFLLEWKRKPTPKPLLLRGARQVGKTHAARVVGTSFSHFVELNLETNAPARKIFESSLDIQLIMVQLSELVGASLVPGKTLLFLDEVQQVPQAITALRYFYEQVPGLHIIAAGSLLDFAIEQVGVPVGRVTSLRMYPLSFIEFLVAVGHGAWAAMIMRQTPDGVVNQALHEKLLTLVATYLAVGGMPEAINEWTQAKTSRAVKAVHEDLLYAYQQDFEKYAKKNQIKYLQMLFDHSLNQAGGKFMFARVGEYKKRELEPALLLLEKAGLMHKVVRTAAQGIPLGAQSMIDDFKLIFMDVGLTQALLKADLTGWFLDPQATFINKGPLVEAFVGNEMLAYADPIGQQMLFYWHRLGRNREAEVDYVVQLNQAVVPVEVKAGTSERIKSMQIFLEDHPQSLYGIRFSTHVYGVHKNVHSYPLYAIIKPLLDASEELRLAVEHLLA